MYTYNGYDLMRVVLVRGREIDDLSTNYTTAIMLNVSNSRLAKSCEVFP